MVTKGMKQAAALAQRQLLGLAYLEEIASDHIRFRTSSIRTIDRAMVICDQLSERLGIVITVAV